MILQKNLQYNNEDMKEKLYLSGEDKDAFYS